MGKKKKSDQKKSKKLFKKKHKRFLIRVILFMVIGGSGLAIWKPELIKNETQRQRVMGVRQTLSQVTTSSQDSLNQRLASLSKSKEATQSIPKTITVGNQEIYLDETINRIATELETIPKEQYQQFRAQFCAPLVATVSSKLEE